MADNQASASTKRTSQFPRMPRGLTAGRHNPFEKGHLIGHVKDSDYFEVPRDLGRQDRDSAVAQNERADCHVSKTGFKPIDDRIEPFDLKITKFMVLELVVAVVLVVLFTRLAAAHQEGATPPRAA